MNDVLAADLALGLTLDHVRSARPDAPVVPDRERRSRRRRGRQARQNKR